MFTQNTSAHSPKFLLRRKKLMGFPLLALPGLIALFVALDGGKGIPDKNAGKTPNGFNAELPKANFDRKEDKMDKMGYYARADADSVKKQEISRQDPYHGHSVDAPPAVDTSADVLLKRLDQLKMTLKQPPSYVPEMQHPGSLSMSPTPPANHPSPLQKRWEQLSLAAHPPNIPGIPDNPNIRDIRDTPDNDPQLEKLNTMLDKIMKIQRTVQDEKSGEPETLRSSESTPDTKMSMELTTIPAEVEGDQTLVSGSRIALRITENCTINQVPIVKGQLVYGWGNINKERMDIVIDGIREGNGIYPVKLQVYDMDGMPGIFIPGLLTREVSKESADQGVSSIGLYSPDGSITSQAASAGIQAAKSLIHHKIKLVSVTVKSGYRVLLRNMHPLREVPQKGAISGNSLSPQATDTTVLTRVIPNWPAPPPPYLHKSTSNGKMQLTLRGIYLRDKTLWFSYSIRNRSSIDFTPEYTRWFIRDRRQLRRTAIQEITLTPLNAELSAGQFQTIPGDSTRAILVDFQPFALANDKELILQIGERYGGRLLVLAIDPNEIINAKKL